MGRVIAPDNVRVAGLLLAWGESNRRDLPWRHTRDPWAVLVSEVMLQQTQVDRVTPRWEAFLRRWPTPQVCAASRPADIISFWVGLGYNRRALNLHRCATAITAEHAGSLPSSLEALLALPGVGPYTARAVLAFAYEDDVGVVDTNVGRILARLHGRRLRPKEAQQCADELVPAGEGWAWNQTMFDFAVAICTKRSPGCGACPLRTECGWAGVGDDPATNSAGTSGRQSTFAGSDRQARGKLIAALGQGPISATEVPEAMELVGETDRAHQLLEGLLSDGMVVATANTVHLPT